jgi:hypothetical protein
LPDASALDRDRRGQAAVVEAKPSSWEAIMRRSGLPGRPSAAGSRPSCAALAPKMTVAGVELLIAVANQDT